MDTTMDTTLVKWGNSQGLRIPKGVCDLLGVDIGARASVQIDAPHSQLTLTFDQPSRKYHRSKKVSLEALCADWQGSKVGEDWIAGDVGAEVVQ